MNSEELDKAIAVLLPNFSRFSNQPISRDGKDILGWHCNIELNNGDVISSGTHISRELARRVAISEAFERSMFNQIAIGPESKRFKIDEMPTSSGFAAGFENESTQFRAVCEGIERWCWSKWIDDQYQIDEVKVDRQKLSPLAQYFYEKFDSVYFFRLSIPFPMVGIQSGPLVLGIVLGETTTGIFPGSRVTSNDDDLWTHGLVEAFRNLANFELGANITRGPGAWYMNRVNYFGKNKGHAFKQIPTQGSKQWPNPIVDLLEAHETGIPHIFLWRCLFQDFVPWHLGDQTRFVY